MIIDFSIRGPAITAADIDAFEVRIGATLPPDYRSFLLEVNGGRPAFHVIRNAETGDIGVKIFYGIWKREYFDLDGERKNMRDRWPSRFLSIAIDDCGNRFCLSLGEPDRGAVCFWDHDWEAEEGEEPTERNLHRVADSFGGFLERMEVIDPDEYMAEYGFNVDGETNPPPTDSPPAADSNGDFASDNDVH